jgi:hypothetical protein
MLNVSTESWVLPAHLNANWNLIIIAEVVVLKKPAPVVPGQMEHVVEDLVLLTRDAKLEHVPLVDVILLVGV